MVVKTCIPCCKLATKVMFQKLVERSRSTQVNELCGRNTSRFSRARNNAGRAFGGLVGNLLSVYSTAILNNEINQYIMLRRVYYMYLITEFLLEKSINTSSVC